MPVLDFQPPPGGLEQTDLAQHFLVSVIHGEDLAMHHRAQSADIPARIEFHAVGEHDPSRYMNNCSRICLCRFAPLRRQKTAPLGAIASITRNGVRRTAIPEQERGQNHSQPR